MIRRFQNVGAVILAAGASRRLGRSKQLLEIEGMPMFFRTYKIVSEVVDGPIFIVTGAFREEIEDYASGSLGLSGAYLTYCPDWHNGMGSSLAHGVGNLLEVDPGLSSVLVTVCDQPYLTASVLGDLIQLSSDHSFRTVACSYDDTSGPPVCFGREHFDELRCLRGERGAKSLLLGCSESLQTLSFPLGVIDIDTPDDLRQIQFQPQAC